MAEPAHGGGRDAVEEATDLLSLGVLMLTLLFSTVLLLNLLIAIMSDSYEMVKESETYESMRGKAQIIVQHERVWPAGTACPTYLHVLLPAEGADDKPLPWEGLAGKMKQEMGMLREQVGQCATKADIVELEKKLEKVLARL